MSTPQSRRIHRVTALTFCLAVVFCLFFQLSKGGPFRDFNPFLNDPYDAVGSFAVQIVILVGALTYARALRSREDSGQAPKIRLILRGNIVVLAAILATLIGDAIAELVVPTPPSFWGNILLAELGLMFLLAAACTVALATAFKRTGTLAPPRGLTPADGIDDLWMLVRFPVTKLRGFLPRRFADGVQHFSSDRLFANARWIDPRRHPWRFASGLGLFMGMLLALAQLQEGPPPSPAIGLLVAGVFVFGELFMTLAGFALLGGFLGLRPPLSRRG